MFDTDLLKLAFALDMARQVIEADHITDYSEYKLWGQIFPRPLLREAGFIDDHGAFTDHFRSAADAARTGLGPKLDEAEKLELLTLFHGASMADGVLDQRELAVLQNGAELLGIAPDALTAHLASLTADDYL